MKRRLLSLLTALSLLLCVAACGLWVRSYWVADIMFFRRPVIHGDRGFDDYHARSLRGRLGFWVTAVRIPISELQDPIDLTEVLLEERGLYRLTRDADRFNLSPDSSVLEVPMWAVVATAAILPLVTLWRWHRKRGSTPGLCAACGYDLRATPGRCPECGTRAVPTAETHR